MRKQLLLGTTALLVGAVAAPGIAAAEDPLRLEVRGYKNEFFGIGDVDDDTEAARGADWGNTSHFSDGEVHFQGETALDNGLTVGVQVELEAFGSTDDDIDEAYSWIEGSFGRLVAGADNLPDYKMFWGVIAPAVGVPINSGWITAWVPQPMGSGLSFLTPGLTTNISLTDDTFQISYTSPRFAGFQLGAGYAPTDAVPGDPKNLVTDEAAEVHDIIGVGLNFARSFAGFDVGLGAGYERGTVAETPEALGADDPQLVKVGASVGFAGFTIAGSYANEFEGRTDLTNTTSEEGQAWDVGASYATGPWGVSATWFHGEEEDDIAVAGDDEVDSVVGAVSYAVGPGITTSFSVHWANWENEDGAESSGTMGILGLVINF